MAPMNTVTAETTTHSRPALRDLIENTEGRLHILILGAGNAGCTFAVKILNFARRFPRCQLQLTVVEDGQVCTSDISGAWLFPFVSTDPRTAQLAIRSFEDTEVLDTAGLADLRERMNSLIISAQPTTEVPPGHPGRAHDADPADYSLSKHYRSAKRIDDGAVISACTLMPKLRWFLHEQPEVRFERLHVNHLHHLARHARAVGADVVIVAAGDRDRFLTADDSVTGDIGVLLYGARDALPELNKRLVLMDEDRNNELTYVIPHRSCGHVLFGGVSGITIDDHYEWEGVTAANRDLANGPHEYRQIVREISERIRDRIPAVAGALPRDLQQPGSYRIAIRPVSARLVLEWIPTEFTADVPMLRIGGLGGSGFTVVNALVDDGIRLPAIADIQIGSRRPGS